jgi:ATP-dependent Clp protease adaptor protein ClpS
MDMISPQQITEERAHSITEHLPPYSVILHNDDDHSMEFVIAALVKSVPSLSAERALEIMMEAHTSDRAVVITCPLEPAELYRDRIKTFGLGVSIERA